MRSSSHNSTLGRGWKILLLAGWLAAYRGDAGEIKPTCAVLTFDARGISDDDAGLLTDRFAIELDRLNVYTLMSRSKMTELLELQQYSRSESCSGLECAIEAGKLLTVQHMVYGSVGKIGSLYTINTYLVNVESGATEKNAFTDQPGSIEAFLTSGMAQNAAALISGNIPQPILEEPEIETPPEPEEEPDEEPAVVEPEPTPTPAANPIREWRRPRSH